MSARTGIDTQRLSAMAQRPGIDTRKWISLATVTDVTYDSAHGMFASVKLIPTGEEIEAMVGVGYAGNQFGDWHPIEKKDVVVVGILDGDNSSGGVIISRVYRASDKPPSELSSGQNVDGTVADATNNVVLRLKSGVKYVLRTAGDDGNIDVKVEGNGSLVLDAAGEGAITVQQTGAGNVYIVAENAASKVYVSDAPNSSGTEQAGKGLTIQGYLESNKTWQDAHTHSAGALASPSGAVTGTTGTPTAGSPTVPDVKATKLNLK